MPQHLEAGTHTQDDITWIKHEYVEGSTKSRHNLTYPEAHIIAQKHFDDGLWENND